MVGEFHAIIHPETPIFHNSGYVLAAEGESVYHPGDSFELPGQQVDVFCAPVCAPWAKMSELLDLARSVANKRTEKFHPYLSDPLLEADYASGSLDVKGAWEVAREVGGMEAGVG